MSVVTLQTENILQRKEYTTYTFSNGNLIQIIMFRVHQLDQEFCLNYDRGFYLLVVKKDILGISRGYEYIEGRPILPKID